MGLDDDGGGDCGGNCDNFFFGIPNLFYVAPNFAFYIVALKI